MSFSILHPVMLMGLFSLAIPLLVHLLSKRRFQVVQWGAMQFLQLHKRTKRKIQLEQLLLMLLRMAMLAILVFAFSHLWGKGGLLSRIIPGSQKDILIVLDSSYSMTEKFDGESLHTKSQNFIFSLLHDLPLQDKIGIIDAREQPMMVIDKPIHDRTTLRKLLSRIPPPTGSTHLPAAIEQAVQTLNDSTTLERDIIILTDMQKIGTELENSLSWQRVDGMLEQLTVKPRIWIYDIRGKNDAPVVNYYINNLKLSRETTVPGFPVKLTATIKVLGQIQPGTTRQIFVSVNGQKLNDKTAQVRMNSEGEASTEFELRLDEAGEFRVTVSLEEDGFEFDNQSERIIVVKTGLPLLIVDGAPDPDPTLAESFFLKHAYAATHETSPWVKASITDLNKLAQVNLQQYQAVILANTVDIPLEIKKQLIARVEQGGNLIIAPGDRSKPELIEGWLNKEGVNCIPARLENVVEIDIKKEENVSMPQGASFVLPWLMKFQEQHGGDLTLTRFSKYWKISPIALEKKKPQSATSKPASPIVQESSIIARLNNQDPWIIQRNIGEGSLCMLSTPLDADWSTLPSKNDYLPFIHELIFSLTNWKSGRNLQVGESLTIELPAETEPGNWSITGPLKSLEFPPQSIKQNDRIFLTLPSSVYAGLYEFTCDKNTPARIPSHYFHVDCQHSESLLTRLTEDEVKLITDDSKRLQVVSNMNDIEESWKVKETGTELWRVLLLFFLVLLIVEVITTRNLIQRGDDTAQSSTPQINLGD